MASLCVRTASFDLIFKIAIMFVRLFDFFNTLQHDSAGKTTQLFDKRKVFQKVPLP